MARIISEEELRKEGKEFYSKRHVRCTGCKLHIRFFDEEVTVDLVKDRAYIVCPSCGYERVLAIGGVKEDRYKPKVES